MSHTSTINGVRITDIDALRATIAELRDNQGIDCELLENAIPRAYYANQAGMDQAAPFVVKLNKSKYDVGLYTAADGNGMECRFDGWSGDVRGQLGSVDPNASTEQNTVGKLLQTYAVNATIRRATLQGKRVERSTVDGSVQLRITA